MTDQDPLTNNLLPEQIQISQKEKLSSTLALIKAEEEFDQSLEINRDNDLIPWRVAKGIADKVHNWGLPDHSAVAALLLPLYTCGEKNALEIEINYGQKVLSLINNLVDWEKVNTSRSENISYYLNRLLFLTYLKYDDFQFVLLLLAQHDAYYDIYDSIPTYLACLSQYVFIPFAEFLGIWSLRQRWLNISTKFMFENALFPEYKQIESLILKLDEKSTHIFNGIKENLFNAIKKKLLSQNEIYELHITNIGKRDFTKGDILSRYKHGYSVAEESLDQLWLKIYCETEIDCYKVLWAIHLLGKPIAPRDNERFFDYVGYAQPNGYKGLESSVTIKLSDLNINNSIRSDMLVRFRIVTEDMEKINSQGVIQAFYNNRTEEYTNNPQYGNAWWNRKQITRILKTINRYSKTKDYSTLSEFLEKNGLGSQSELVYVFTPKGEIQILPNGSMPLDFAYQIHSEVGNHTYQIEVNGQIVDFSYRLKNGDIVNILSNSRLSTPDFSWLKFVYTSEARSKIRNWLLFNTIKLPSGYKIIHDELIKIIDYYRTVKNFDFSISKHRLELFLDRYAKANAYIDIKHFFDSIKTDKEDFVKGHRNILATHVVQRFISDELTSLLRDENGRSLEIPSFRFRFCGHCRPVPGESIIGSIYESDNKQRIVVHAQNCNQNLSEKKKIILKWFNETTSQVFFFEFQIDAKDRFKLLADVLDIVYSKNTDFYLKRLNTLTNEEGFAKIYLTLSSPHIDQLMDIRLRLETVDGVRRVWAEPVSQFTTISYLGESLTAANSQNPYIETVVSTPEKFFDREKPIKDITTWLQSGEGPTWQVLHGIKRVGKSSFGSYLVGSHLHNKGIVYPIYRDLQGFIDCSFEDIAKYILSEEMGVFKNLNSSIPPKNPSESVLDWFLRCLKIAYQKVGKLTLFIFLDEFDFLIGRVNENEINPDVIQGLLGLFNCDIPVRWLISISDTYFRSPELLGDSIHLIKKTNGIPLDPFDVNISDLLIREPMEQSGFFYPDKKYINKNEYPDAINMEQSGLFKNEKKSKNKKKEPIPITSEIRNLSGGIPFYLKKICYYLFERVKKAGRNNITRDDLNESISDCLLDGKVIFSHYIDILQRNPIQIIVFKEIANSTNKENWISFNILLINILKNYPSLTKTDITKSIDSMVGHSILEEEITTKGRSFRIPVQLFAKWVRDGNLNEYESYQKNL